MAEQRGNGDGWRVCVSIESSVFIWYFFMWTCAQLSWIDWMLTLLFGTSIKCIQHTQHTHLNTVFLLLHLHHVFCGAAHSTVGRLAEVFTWNKRQKNNKVIRLMKKITREVLSVSCRCAVEFDSRGFPLWSGLSSQVRLERKFIFKHSMYPR